ncbi:MAG: Hint domain-containing protein [Roseovarius sp.]
MAKGKVPAGAGAGDTDERVFVVAGGDWCIEGFGPRDVIAVDCPGITDIAAWRACLGDDAPGGARITLPDGSVTRVAGLDGRSLGALGEDRVRFGPGPAGFLRGTLIGTAEGARRVETLRPGDLILTRDHACEDLVRGVGAGSGQVRGGLAETKMRSGSVGTKGRVRRDEGAGRVGVAPGGACDVRGRVRFAAVRTRQSGRQGPGRQGPGREGLVCDGPGARRVLATRIRVRGSGRGAVAGLADRA